MIRRSLRLRLILAFSAMVSLILFVGLASYAIYDGVRREVREVRRGSAYDLTTHDDARVGLEITGYWNPAGSFMAEDIQPQTVQEPRLRGPIQYINAEDSTVRLYGIDVAITSDTENGDDKTRPVSFDSLRHGQRVEIKCEVVDGTWRATKLYAQNVNASNKIKGMVTRRQLDGEPPESIFFYDLEIVVEPRPESGPLSALARVEQAGRMIVQLQSCRAAALKLATEAFHRGPEGEQARRQAADELTDSNERFREMMAVSQLEGVDRHSAPLGKFREYLEDLTGFQKTQDKHIATLTRMAGEGVEGEVLRDFIHEQFDPFLADKVMPKLTTYLWEGEDELGDQMRAMLKRAELTPRLALGVSVVAVALAVLLGLLVWRSIHLPIQRLQDAAVRIGHGHLDTRIEITTQDELGELSEAFNRMASDLSTTTLTMASLESVFDSMAAALIVFGADGRITSVNRATCDWTGHDREQLLGRTLRVLCRFEQGESVKPIVTVAADKRTGDEAITSVERVFVRKDGSEFPVALSGAELGGGDGPVQGYVCVAQDLTEQKRIQQTIRDSLAEKEVLLREVHHRVKNNIQVISSLLEMQTSAGDPEVARRLQESQNRIRTIALIHEHLYLSAEVAHIDLSSYLAVLAEHLLQSFAAIDTVQLSLAVQDLGLDVDQSMSIGLIVNELMTNSLKYAFPADRRGTIGIELFANGDGTNTLLVSDDGQGYSGTKRSGPPSLGTDLVHTLARQLKGSVDIDSSGGTTTRIVFGKPSSSKTQDGKGVTS